MEKLSPLRLPQGKREVRKKVRSYSLNGSKLTRAGQEVLHENNIEDTLRLIHEADLDHTGNCKVLQQKCLAQYRAENLRGYLGNLRNLSYIFATNICYIGVGDFWIDQINQSVSSHIHHLNNYHPRSYPIPIQVGKNQINIRINFLSNFHPHITRKIPILTNINFLYFKITIHHAPKHNRILPGGRACVSLESLSLGPRIQTIRDDHRGS